MSVRLWITLPIRLVFAALVAVVLVLPALAIFGAFESERRFRHTRSHLIELLARIIVP